MCGLYSAFLDNNHGHFRTMAPFNGVLVTGAGCRRARGSTYSEKRHLKQSRELFLMIKLFREAIPKWCVRSLAAGLHRSKPALQ